MTFFQYLTPITYWLLIIIWSYILWFYLKRLKTPRIKTKPTITLIIILAIEAFRTLFESLYFGAWYTSLQGLLPREVHAFLVQPNLVIIPKLMNVLAAFLIILILLRRWLPQEEAQAEELKRLIKNRTRELAEKNQQLNEEIRQREPIELELKQHRAHLENMVKERTEQLASSNQKLRTEIAERQAAEEKMRQAYTDLDQIFNSTSVAIRVIDNQYRLIRVNDRFLQITGYRRQDIPALKCHQLFKGSTCLTDQCTLRQIDQGLDRYEIEIEKELPNGERVPYLLTAAPYRDTQGNRIGVIESFLDINSRKEAERTIREERDLFMEGKVVVFKWRNQDAWPVAYVSANVAKTLGYQADDFLQQRIRYQDIVDERDWPRIRQHKTEAVQDGQTFLEHAPYRLRRKNGETVWVLDYTRFVPDESGQVDFFHGYIIDISQYKETEEKLENQAQLAHTGRLTALGEMASGMAHELNQPMTVIRLAADALKMYFETQTPTRRKPKRSPISSARSHERRKSSRICAPSPRPNRASSIPSMLPNPLKMRFPSLRTNSAFTRSGCSKPCNPISPASPLIPRNSNRSWLT